VILFLDTSALIKLYASAARETLERLRGMLGDDRAVLLRDGRLTLNNHPGTSCLARLRDALRLTIL
jgi:hypothetical protein